MEKSPSSLGNLWLPYAVAGALVAVGILGGPHVAPTRPGLDETGLGEPSSETQSIPARLWQDPLEATETIRRAIRIGQGENSPKNMTVTLDELIWRHTRVDGKPLPDGTMDYASASHRVLFQFVSLPSDALPEASEQRIRARVAIVSALSTAGYRPANAARLGVTVWDPTPQKAITTQIAYPFEVFELDFIRNAILPTLKQPARKFDEVIVIYVEDGALEADQQFEWLKRLSRLLAAASPKERFVEKLWIRAQWLGPITSDRLVALLRAVNAEYASGATDLDPLPEEAVPVNVLAVRPTIEASFVDQIVKPTKPPEHFPADSSWSRFFTTVRNGSRLICLGQRCNDQGDSSAWLTLERLGCDDASLTQALVHELTLRKPGLFDGTQEGTVALLSEWDTLYGRALPESFAKQFLKQDGKASDLKRFTYLRGLDGQIAGNLEKSTPKSDKQTSATAKASDSAELFRQLLSSRAPSIAFGRTQVDYVDRFAAQLRSFQRAAPRNHLEAVGILGSDTYDKLLILQGLRKVFPSIQYFTTEMDASLFAPENYEVTRNLVVATGFDLHLHEKYQGKILPFRDSAQASLYFATLYATEYLKMKQNLEIVGLPFDYWYPSVAEIGRSGPYRMKTIHPAGSLHDTLAKAEALSPVGPTQSPSPEKHSPLLADSVSTRDLWRPWLVPLVAVAVVLIVTMTDFGRLAVRDSMEAIRVVFRALYRLVFRRGKSASLRYLTLCLTSDLAIWLLIFATIAFLAIAFWIPRIAALPDQEPFAIAEGISSWPATWLRALGIFLCAYYFWLVAWQFRHALANGSRELALGAPVCSPSGVRPDRPAPCKAWDRFIRRSRSWKIKMAVLLTWILYVGLAIFLFTQLDLPAQVTRGLTSIAWEKRVLMCAVFSINLLIVYAVVHNLSCAFFVRKVGEWLGRPGPSGECDEPLHTALMRAIAHVAGAMTQMIYYPFTLLFLLLAARHSLFDNFDWPVLLITVFAISSGVLLASTLVLRRTADRARKNAVTWLQARIASLNWLMTQGETTPTRARNQVALERAEWQLAQVNQVGGAALTEGVFSNPLLRAVLIPLGGTGLLQLMETAGKLF